MENEQQMPMQCGCGGKWHHKHHGCKRHGGCGCGVWFVGLPSVVAYRSKLHVAFCDATTQQVVHARYLPNGTLDLPLVTL